MTSSTVPTVILGVSLKMYFDPTETSVWCSAVADLARRHDALTSGCVALFVLPDFTGISTAVSLFDGTAVAVGAQDLFWEDRGAFTGEVSGTDLRSLGCSFVEIGHAERRALLGEDGTVFNKKVAAAARNGLTPVLCVGEQTQGTPDEAANACIRQLAEALEGLSGGPSRLPLVVAYEPEWAIGAAQAATAGYVSAVAIRLRRWLKARPGFEDSRIIYGGSAGPGLLTELGDAVDGLFLGRFAHDPSAVESIINEVVAPK